MTNRFIFLAIAFASACASHPQRPTYPVRYACGDATITRTGERLTVGVQTASIEPMGHAAQVALGWSDDDADHFVSWPNATTDVDTVEYVVPRDARKDALQKHYDASAGYSSSDWRLLDSQVCRAEGGYNDALARYMNGDSLDSIAKALSLKDRETARKLVHQALASLHKRYFNDR